VIDGPWMVSFQIYLLSLPSIQDVGSCTSDWWSFDGLISNLYLLSPSPFLKWDHPRTINQWYMIQHLVWRGW
jgi:hypothetical protein